MQPSQVADCIVKASIIGDKKAGKTNLLTRICHDYFSPTYTQTVGIDFMSKMVTVGGNNIKIQFWDTETSQKSQTSEVKELICKGAICLIFVYSIVDGQSYIFVERKISELSKFFCPALIPVLIGNKADLQQNRKVDKDKGKILAQRNEMIFAEISSKDGSNIKETMLQIKQRINEIIEDENSG